MKKEDLLKAGLTDEQAKTVLDMYKSDTANLVPSSRLSEVIAERNELREKTKAQLDTISKSDSDVTTLKQQIAQIQQENEKAIKEADAKYQALQLDTALNKLAAESGAYDVRALKAYLDISDAKADSDGEYRTIKTQIDALKADESKSFLFKSLEPPKPTAPQIKGVKVDSGISSPVPTMGYQERWRNAIAKGNTAEAVAIKGEAAAEGVYF